MKLTNKDDVDPCQEVVLRCPIVDRMSTLVRFLQAEDGKMYRFSTVAQAHHATQALLEEMATDLNITADSEA